jgi:hypothetical protein
MVRHERRAEMQPVLAGAPEPSLSPLPSSMRYCIHAVGMESMGMQAEARTLAPRLTMAARSSDTSAYPRHGQAWSCAMTSSVEIINRTTGA